MITEKEATKLELIEHYIFTSPRHKIDTIRFGRIRYFDWLCRERDIIAAIPGRKAEIRYNAKGEVALFVNDISEEYSAIGKDER